MKCQVCEKDFESEEALTKHCDRPDICVFCHSTNLELEGDRLNCKDCGRWVHKVYGAIQKATYDKRYQKQ